MPNEKITTMEPVQTSASAVTHQQPQPRPEFIRLPATGKRCAYTGLSRSKMNELILPCVANNHRPPVVSKVLRQKGQTKGARLIVFDSLLAYINSQTPETTTTAKGGSNDR